MDMLTLFVGTNRSNRVVLMIQATLSHTRREDRYTTPGILVCQMKWKMRLWQLRLVGLKSQNIDLESSHLVCSVTLLSNAATAFHCVVSHRSEESWWLSHIPFWQQGAVQFNSFSNAATMCVHAGGYAADYRRRQR